MTRINSAIPVTNLTDEHLLAEHREIKRLPYYLQKAIVSGSINNIPNKFCLGKGHVLFFLNKMKFISERYRQLHNECLARGFSIADYSSNFNHISQQFSNDYKPTLHELLLLRLRINDRIINGKCKYYHYYGNRITKEFACKLLMQ